MPKCRSQNHVALAQKLAVMNDTAHNNSEIILKNFCRPE